VKAKQQIEKSETLLGLRRGVENVENTLANEVFEWFTLFRYPRFN
jgi:precorrin-6B methylase 1